MFSVPFKFSTKHEEKLKSDTVMETEGSHFTRNSVCVTNGRRYIHTQVILSPWTVHCQTRN